MAASIIIIVCCLISAIIGIRESHLSKGKDIAFFGLTYSGLILVILAIIGSSATIIEKYLAYRDIKIKKQLEQDKLKFVAIETKSAVNPLLVFLSSFLSSNGQAKAYIVFSENHNDEIGKNYPSPHIMDQVIYVFLVSPLFLPSNVKTFPESKEISWFQVLYDAIMKSHYKCDLVLKHYGSVNHPIIGVVSELKIRAENQLMIMQATQMHPDIKKLWKNGISDEQHLDFFRYYFLTLVKVNRYIREILKE